MASTQAMVTQFKRDILNGIHALGTTVVRASTTADTFFSALFLDTATLSATTNLYTGTAGVGMANENSGTGYTAGGVTCAWIAPSTSGTTAFTTLSASITYTTITTPSAVSAVLIYNSTQGTSGNRPAVAVYTFTAQTITAGTLALTMPTNDASTGLLRIA
jgi:hypothetical protein